MQILPFWVLYQIQKPIYPQKKNQIVGLDNWVVSKKRSEAITQI